jgi:predicted ester cyclase
MTLEETKQLVERFYDELYNQHNLTIVDDVLSDNYVSHENRGHGQKEINLYPGDMKEMVRMYYSAFPDQKTTIDEIRVVGDKVVTHWATRGTHYGYFMGIAPTRKQVTIRGTCVDWVVGDKIVESWVNWDLATLLNQLEITEAEKAA